MVALLLETMAHPDEPPEPGCSRPGCGWSREARLDRQPERPVVVRRPRPRGRAAGGLLARRWPRAPSGAGGVRPGGGLAAAGLGLAATWTLPACAEAGCDSGHAGLVRPAGRRRPADRRSATCWPRPCRRRTLVRGRAVALRHRPRGPPARRTRSATSGRPATRASGTSVGHWTWYAGVAVIVGDARLRRWRAAGAARSPAALAARASAVGARGGPTPTGGEFTGPGSALAVARVDLGSRRHRSATGALLGLRRRRPAVRRRRGRRLPSADGRTFLHSQGSSAKHDAGTLVMRVTTT